MVYVVFPAAPSTRSCTTARRPSESPCSVADGNFGGAFGDTAVSNQAVYRGDFENIGGDSGHQTNYENLRDGGRQGPGVREGDGGDPAPHGRGRCLKPSKGAMRQMTTSVKQALASSRLSRAMTSEHLNAKKWPRKRRRGDLLEVFARTSMISVRAAHYWNMRVLQPIDVKFGCDLRDAKKRKVLERYDPRLVVVEFPCRVWTVLQKNVNYKDRPEELEQRRQADRPFLEFAEDIFESQRRRGGHALLENPAAPAGS